jgi:hypothetical protein
MNPSYQNQSNGLLAQKFLVVLPTVFVLGIAYGAKVGLSAITPPDVGVVLRAFEEMRENETVVIGAGLHHQILFAADTTVGQLLVTFRARNTSDRRKRAAVGTAHVILFLNTYNQDLQSLYPH